MEIISEPDEALSLMPVMPLRPATAKLFAPVTATMLMPDPPISVVLAPEAEPAKPPAPPAIELLAPLAVNRVVPEDAPKMVDAPAAVTVSLGAAKMREAVVTVTEFPPADVSTTAVAPERVTAEFDAETMTGPLTVDTPPPETTVNVVLELKNVLRAAVAAPAPLKLAGTVPPLTVAIPMSFCLAPRLVDQAAAGALDRRVTKPK
ncbi:MAG: hypothetical protein HIU92_17830 [Proteobacteria bacterium]|nr:hypothetical protein [Pseudomonadota bacterium]